MRPHWVGPGDGLCDGERGRLWIPVVFDLRLLAQERETGLRHEDARGTYMLDGPLPDGEAPLDGDLDDVRRVLP